MIETLQKKDSSQTAWRTISFLVFHATWEELAKQAETTVPTISFLVLHATSEELAKQAEVTVPNAAQRIGTNLNFTASWALLIKLLSLLDNFPPSHNFGGVLFLSSPLYGSTQSACQLTYSDTSFGGVDPLRAGNET